MTLEEFNAWCEGLACFEASHQFNDESWLVVMLNGDTCSFSQVA